jgi:hypothetical protein
MIMYYHFLSQINVSSEVHLQSVFGKHGHRNSEELEHSEKRVTNVSL